MKKFKTLFRRKRRESQQEEAGPVVEGLTEETEFDLSLRGAFDLFDTNGNGIIERHELPAVMSKVLGITPTERQISRVLTKFDLNEDGTLEFEEFRKMMYQRTGVKSEVKEGFLEMDLDNDLVISKEELMIGLNRFEPVTEEEVDEILEAADLNNDGKINFKEYLMYFV